MKTNPIKQTIHHVTMELTITALMAALVFTGTYFFKIPFAFGYAHLGDGIILLTVCLFGTRRGMAAGAIGAGLADLLGGYPIWVLPTMCLKALWALILGIFLYKLFPHTKYSWLTGSIIGGILHTLGYTLVKIPLYGTALALAELFTTGCQSAVGIILCGVAYTVLCHSSAVQILRCRE